MHNPIGRYVSCLRAHGISVPPSSSEAAALKAHGPSAARKAAEAACRRAL